MQLLTFGGLSLEPSSFTRPKPLLLLAFLAVEGPQSRRRLAELFWQGSPDARDALSTTLRRLRDPLGDAIRIKSTQVATQLRSDAGDFLRALDAEEPESALKHYQGPFLAGLDIDLGEERDAQSVLQCVLPFMRGSSSCIPTPYPDRTKGVRSLTDATPILPIWCIVLGA